MVGDGYVGSGVRTMTVQHRKGNEFSGGSGAPNRQLSVSAEDIILGIDSQLQHKDVQYTYDGSTLTVLDPLADDSDVMIVEIALP